MCGGAPTSPTLPNWQNFSDTILDKVSLNAQIKKIRKEIKIKEMRRKPIIIKKYGDKYKVTICNIDVWQKDTEYIENGLKKENEEIGKLRNNISRAKNKVFEYAKCNDWDYFATLTLDKAKRDRCDLQAYIRDLGRFIRNERRKGCDIKYLLIPEQHKDAAWHMHGYFSGIPVSDVQINSYGYYEWSRYAKRFGYCSLDKIKDKERCDNYITKYISKEMGGLAIEKNKKLYYTSRGLHTAEVIHQAYTSEKINKPDFENDFVQIKWLNTFAEVQALISLL